MRKFYVFNIKEEFKELYNDNSYFLFNILRNIYNLDSSEVSYALTLLDQLENRFDKYEMDKYIYIKLHKEVPYSKKGEVHYINNLFKDEVSKMIVTNRYIKIISDSNYSSFFDILSTLGDNYFVCDFNYLNYFFIDKLKKVSTK